MNIVRDSLDYVTSARLREDFDVLGFDPRGVAASSAVSRELRTNLPPMRAVALAEA